MNLELNNDELDLLMEYCLEHKLFIAMVALG